MKKLGLVVKLQFTRIPCPKAEQAVTLGYHSYYFLS